MHTADPSVEGRGSASLAAHVKATLLLGLPLAGAQLAQIAIHVTDTVMIGWLGTEALAAGVLGAQLFHLVWMFGSGLAIAVMPMAATAAGRGDVRAVRRSVRMGLWVVMLYAVLVMPLLWHAEWIFLTLGQAPATAAMAGLYMRALQWAMFPALAFMVLRSFFSALERPRVLLLTAVGSAVLNALFCYMLVFGALGAPAFGIVGAGIASVLTMAGAAIFLGLYASLTADLRRYQLFIRIWRPDWPGFLEVLRLGWPIGATIVAEVGLFAASSIMVGWIGTIELAAHGIALQLASIAFMIPLGLGSAATVRVGLAYGRRDPIGVGRAARAAMLVGLVIALIAALVFWVIPRPLIALYLSDADPHAGTVLAYAIPLLAVAAAFQLFDSGQVLASGVLRGLKDTRVPMFIALLSYWGVGMPVAYALAFPAGWGAVGVWAGLGIGLLTAAGLLSGRFLARERAGRLLVGAGGPAAQRTRRRYTTLNYILGRLP